MVENRRGKDKRYYYTRGQMVLLGGAFVLAGLIIFFLGVFFGKGIEERKLVKNEEPLVKVPVKPSSQGSSGSAARQPKEELTFYDTLTKAPAAPPAGENKLKETKPSEKTAKPEPKETEARTRKDAPAAKTPENKKEQASASGDSTAAETAERDENGKTWTVQVNAFADERPAKTLVDRLKNKGYNAYVTETQSKGKTWHRVRIGKYGSREEADKALASLKAKENLPQGAYVASR